MSIIRKKLKVWKNRKYLQENLLCEVELCGTLAKTVIDQANYSNHTTNYERFVVLEPLHSNRYGTRPLFRVKRAVDSDGDLLNLDMLTEYGIYVYSDADNFYYYYIVRKDSKRPLFISRDPCPPNDSYIISIYKDEFNINNLVSMVKGASEEIDGFWLDDFDEYDDYDDEEEDDDDGVDKSMVRCIDCDNCIKRFWVSDQNWCKTSLLEREDNPMEAYDINEISHCYDFKKKEV